MRTARAFQKRSFIYGMMDCMNSVFSYDKDTGHVTRNGVRAGTVSKGYRKIQHKGKQYAEHRLIWFLVTGSWPAQLIDHIDGDGLNNKWSNLREASGSENSSNKKLNQNSTSGIKGVRCTDSGKWLGECRKKGKRFSKIFPTEAEAVAYVRSIREQLHGEYANHGDVK